MGRWGGRDSPHCRAMDGPYGPKYAAGTGGRGRPATSENTFTKKKVSEPKEKPDNSLEGLEKQYAEVKAEVDSQTMPSRGLLNKYQSLHEKVKKAKAKGGGGSSGGQHHDPSTGQFT